LRVGERGTLDVSSTIVAAKSTDGAPDDSDTGGPLSRRNVAHFQFSGVNGYAALPVAVLELGVGRSAFPNCGRPLCVTIKDGLGSIVAIGIERLSATSGYRS
jgi:hypothetical protein